jgi:hypothetical protein
MLGRTLLNTALTRAQSLVVIVGQQRALAMAVKDWRRVTRSTALAGLLSGSIAYSWPRTTTSLAEAELALDMPEAWEGLLEAGTA